MRLIFGVLLPLLIQLPIGIGLLFGDIIKTPGGSFVPLMVMLLAAPLAFITLIFNAVRVFDRKAAHSTAGLFVRGLLTAMTVPVIMLILLAVGPVFLN
ncbi:MAG: hypothetical protein JNM76_12570 [Betaproteobacteria bacterium]|nr:hypothetical protein [Betaproteobacteria bacterium]